MKKIIVTLLLVSVFSSKANSQCFDNEQYGGVWEGDGHNLSILFECTKGNEKYHIWSDKYGSSNFTQTLEHNKLIRVHFENMILDIVAPDKNKAISNTKIRVFSFSKYSDWDESSLFLKTPW